MHMKLINTRMQDFKKQKSADQKFTCFANDDKENILINRYEQKQEQKNSQKRYLHQAEKLIMNQRLKEIVADNVQYFRNILQAKEVYRPNSHTLKLPGKVVSSLYQSEYIKKKQYQSQNSSIDVQRTHFNRQQNISESKLPVKTTYQNQFKKFQEIKLKEHRKPKGIKDLLSRSISSKAPSFLDTHNSLQYRNWGTGSVMPSMKPQPHAATTDMPFKANSMYRTEFHSVQLPKTQLVTHEETFPHSVDLWMGKSSYEKDFQKKKVQGLQQGYKPRETPGATNLPFRSTTQYKQSFMEQMSQKTPDMKKSKKKSTGNKLSNQDLQKLVMDL